MNVCTVGSALQNAKLQYRLEFWDLHGKVTSIVSLHQENQILLNWYLAHLLPNKYK